VAISRTRKANHRAVTHGRGSRIRHLEEELVQWMLKLRKQGIAINYKYVVDGHFPRLMPGLDSDREFTAAHPNAAQL
jgi:hypothetical protein